MQNKQANRFKTLDYHLDNHFVFEWFFVLHSHSIWHNPGFFNRINPI